MTLRLPIAVLLLISACASPRKGEARELADDRFIITENGAACGEERVLLRTTADFGKRASSRLELWHPRRTPRTLEIEAAPDWSIRKFRVEDAGDGERRRSLLFTFKRGAPEPAVAVESDSGDTMLTFDGADGAPATVVCDAAALPIFWIRGGIFNDRELRTTPAIVVSLDDLTYRVENVTFERAPDRGRRKCFRYKIAAGAWREIEADLRDWPHLLRVDSRIAARETRPSITPPRGEL